MKIKMIIPNMATFCFTSGSNRKHLKPDFASKSTKTIAVVLAIMI